MNIGTTERVIRIVTGLGLFSMLVLLSTEWRWVGLIGWVPLVTGAIGWCPVYAWLKRI
ncbi:DUF2892 domain-containing protein [Undibacterium arcticum]|uniref:DUF2892 domain-containing protein n=1 Tax=Undibacterium arcticum TaxID=1762892 RepID=A0ABV7F1G2_9BURK